MYKPKIGDVFWIEPKSFSTTKDDEGRKGKRIKGTVVSLHNHFFTVEFQLRGGAVRESYRYIEVLEFELVQEK